MRSIPDPGARAALPPADDADVLASYLSLRGLLTTAKRSAWMVVVAVAIAVGITMYQLSRQPYVYESAATLLFPDQGDQLRLASDMNPLQPARGNQMATHLAVLRSRRIAEIVVDSLALQLRLEDSDVERNDVFPDIHRTGMPSPGRYQIAADGGGYRITDAVTGELIHTGQFGTSSSFLGFTSTVIAAGIPPETGMPFAIDPVRSAADRLRGSVTYTQPDPGAQVLQVRHRTGDATLAAQVPNAIASAFIDYQTGIEQLESRSMVEFLDEQVNSYEEQLVAAEQDLRAFREAGQVVNLETEAEAQIDRLAQLQAQRTQLSSEREALTELLEGIDRASDSGASTRGYRQLASFPVFLANSAVQDILSSLGELENQRAELLVRRTAENLDIQGIDGRIGDLEEELYQLARGYLGGLNNQLAALERNLSAFQQDLELIPARELQYARLVRQQDLVEELYTLLQRRLQETQIQNAVQSESVQLLDPALPPTSPVSPTPISSLLFATVLGLGIGAALIVLRYLTDRKVRTEDEAAAIAEIPLLGLIPHLRDNGGSPLAPSSWRRLLPGQTAVVANGDALVMDRKPQSPAAEAYRSLRTIVNLEAAGRYRLLMVTSAVPGEGKTTTASNLAVALAQQGGRVLLVDADLRGGRVHQLFDLPQSPGLSDILTGGPADGVGHLVEVSGSDTPLAVMTRGNPSARPTELLASDRMSGFLGEWRDQYEYVILDSAALIPVADPAALSQLVDAIVLVARSGHTERGQLERAEKDLERLGIPTLGLILNDLPIEQTSYAYPANESADRRALAIGNGA